MAEPSIAIPLRNKAREVVATATVDAIDAEFANWRWYRNGQGYAVRHVKRNDGSNRDTLVYLHREILGLVLGDKVQCDHIDGDRLNCRRKNLRMTNNAGNGQNRGSVNGSTSKFRGVSWMKSSHKWQAQVTINGCNNWLGLYDSETDAAAVASAFRLAHMPYTNEERRSS